MTGADPEPPPDPRAQLRAGRARPERVRELLVLAWPAALSFLLNSAYRINDQFWVQGLGPSAQAALGAVMFVAIMNFAAAFAACGGLLSLVARGVGARDESRVGHVTRHALLLATGVGVGLSVAGMAATPGITALLGLGGETRALASEYLVGLYAVFLPLALAPAVDQAFIGRGNTWFPMALQGLAIAINFFLNPLLIYGAGAAEAVAGVPGAGAAAALAADLAARLGVDGLGMTGAALATGLSRLATVGIGLLVLRFAYGTPLVGSGRPRAATLLELLRIGAPIGLSIAVYAGVYWVLFALVLSALPDTVVAGLGIGFQVFEGIAYPCFLGLATAAAALVGRALGAHDLREAADAVASARAVGRVVGVFFTLAFLLGARPLGALFTNDPEVLSEIVTYVFALAASQYFVAVETLNERVLIGSGSTRSIPWIAGCGNVLRIPLAYALALPLGLGALGVWWAINATTYLKAFLFWRQVRRADWLRGGAHAPGG